MVIFIPCNSSCAVSDPVE